MSRIQELEMQRKECNKNLKEFLATHKAFDQQRTELFNEEKDIAAKTKKIQFAQTQIQEIEDLIKKQEEALAQQAQINDEKYTSLSENLKKNKEKLASLKSSKKNTEIDKVLLENTFKQKHAVFKTLPEYKQFTQFKQTDARLKNEIDHIKKNGDTPYTPPSPPPTQTDTLKTAGVIQNPKPGQGRGLVPVDHLSLLAKDPEWQAAFCQKNGYISHQTSSTIHFQSTTTPDAKITVKEDGVNVSKPSTSKEQDKLIHDAMQIHLKSCLPHELYAHCIYVKDPEMKEKAEKELARQLIALGAREFRINGKTQEKFLTLEPPQEDINVLRTPQEQPRPSSLHP